MSFYRWMRQFLLFSFKQRHCVLLGNLFTLLAIFTLHSIRSVQRSSNEYFIRIYLHLYSARWNLKKNTESILYAACKWDDEMFLCFSVLPASLPCSYRICTVYKLTGFWLWFSLVLTIHKTSICTKSEVRWIANQQIWIWNLQNPARVHIFRR